MLDYDKIFSIEDDEELEEYYWSIIKPEVVNNIYVIVKGTYEKVYVDDSFSLRDFLALIDTSNAKWLCINKPISDDVREIMEDIYMEAIPQEPGDYRVDYDACSEYDPHRHWASEDEINSFWYGED